MWIHSNIVFFPNNAAGNNSWYVVINKPRKAGCFQDNAVCEKIKAKNVKKGKRRNSDIDLILQASFEKSFVALSRCADIEEDRTERVMSSRLLVLF